MNTKVMVMENLGDKAKRWRRAMTDAACGPLQVAGEVVALSEQWQLYRADAQGLALTTWLRKALGAGRGLPFFQQRAKAVEVLGKSIARSMHHEVAVWMLNNVPADVRENAVFVVMRATQTHNGNVPLSIKQAQRVVRDLIGKRQMKVHCARCAQLEALLMQNGIAPPAR